jgi:hypothetical protein
MKELEKQGVLYLLKFEELQTYSVGPRGGTKTRAIYRLPKRETLKLIKGAAA